MISKAKASFEKALEVMMELKIVLFDFETFILLRKLEIS